VLNANFRLGLAENANRLCEVATTGKMPATVRIMALRMLSEWAEPSGRDQVVGVWRPVPARSAVPARQALGPRLAALIQSAPDSVRTAAIHAIANLKMADAGPLLAALATDDRQTDDTRAEALRALETLGDARRGEVAVRALSMPGADSRTQALRILAGVDPAAATSAIERTLEHGNTRERQGAFATLAALAGDASRRALSTWLDRLIEGKVAPELELDLLEAAARRRDPELAKKVDRYQAARSGSDPLAPYRPALAGGNALRGFRVFSSKADVECLRCHKIKGQGERSAIGGEVGPELTGIGSRQNREYILQSIVEPNKQIAQGFESIVLATDDGKVVTGVLRGEDDKSVRLITAEGKPLVVSKDSIDERKRGPSAMPNDLVKKLSLGELRDLIEFLASSKAETKVP
jgi:quinoprotein glucose dehydrogenase